ncbi:MAG: hypothetical protein ACI9OJ_001483 [Myxococcota bacterium]|jgi:hypothetical protein
MTLEEMDQFLSQLKIGSDIRRAPDGPRRSNFLRGWGAFVKGEVYNPKTLGHLSWNNLGNQLAKHLGATSGAEAKAVFAVAKEDWAVRGRRSDPPADATPPEESSS